MRNGHLDGTREGIISTTRRSVLDGMQLSIAPLTISTLRVHLHPARHDRSSGLLSTAKARKATTVPVVRVSLPRVRVLEAGLESVPRSTSSSRVPVVRCSFL